MELTFIHPVYLWLLLITPIILITHFYGLKYTKRVAIKFANFEAIARVAGGQKFSANIYLVLLRTFSIILIILALTSPILWHIGKSSDFDFILAIDSSGSMLAEDFSPNRLSVAKSSAEEFLTFIPQKANVGVVSFTGTTFVKQMPTNDLEKVKEALHNIIIEKVGGTAIGEAIVTSTNLLLTEDKAKVIVLLTDGQSNVGVIPDEAIEYANSNRVTIHTIGMGTEEGGKVEESTFVAKLDEELLKKIAENTGGKYYRAEDEVELKSAYKEIAMFSEKKVPLELEVYLLAGGLLLLIIEWVLINTKFRTIP